MQFKDKDGNFVCPMCGDKIDDTKFKDKLSAREFKISGLCQKCQDEIFHSDEDDNA